MKPGRGSSETSENTISVAHRGVKDFMEINGLSGS